LEEIKGSYNLTPRSNEKRNIVERNFPKNASSNKNFSLSMKDILKSHNMPAAVTVNEVNYFGDIKTAKPYVSTKNVTKGLKVSKTSLQKQNFATDH